MKEKQKVVLLDDEERIVRSVKMLLRSDYKVKATTSPEEALEYLKDNRVMAIVSDQRMPEMMGVEVLKRAKEISPGTMRLLLTGYSDQADIIGSVNEGEIYRYIHKPWDPQLLKDIVAEAVETAERTYDSFNEVSDGVQSVENSEKTFNVLVLDEDPEAISRILSIENKQLNFTVASDLKQAHTILAEEHIDILVTEIKFKKGNMSLSIKKLKKHFPKLLTIVNTSFKDSTALISLINEGQIFRFLPKPLSVVMLDRALRTACSKIEMYDEAPQLLERNRVENDKSETDSSSGETEIKKLASMLIQRMKRKELGLRQ